MRAPFIHLNGTSREELENQLEEVNQALHEALDRLAVAAPHGRDYYVLEAGAYEQARREHDSRVERIRSVKTEIMELWEAIQAQAR